MRWVYRKYASKEQHFSGFYDKAENYVQEMKNRGLELDFHENTLHQISPGLAREFSNLKENGVLYIESEKTFFC